MIQDSPQSAHGLTPNVAAGLASLFGIIGGIVILLGKPAQQWVRFVAVQSIVLWAAWIAFLIAINIVMSIVAFIPGLRLVLIPVVLIVQLLIGLAVLRRLADRDDQAFQGQALRAAGRGRHTPTAGPARRAARSETDAREQRALRRGSRSFA